MPLESLLRTKGKALLLLILLMSFGYTTEIFLGISSIEHNTDKLIILNDGSSGNSLGGFNLFVMERHDRSTWAMINRTLLITDLDNNIYLSREIEYEGALANYAAEFINSTTILYGDVGGAHLLNLDTEEVKFLNFSGHHEYEKNYANGTYFTFHGDSLEIEGNLYGFDKIMEFTEEGELVWHVNLTSFVNYTQWCPYEDYEGPYRDVTHCNSIFYDEDEDVLYINSRNVNTFYKIDHKTGELIWAVGEYGNFTMFDIFGNEKDNLFYHGHALEKIGKNRFILFDNDEHNQTDAANHHSRLLEITVDEDKMFANVSWEWISPVEYYRGWWGDSDRLANNNSFGVFSSGWLVEVNMTGDIVWEKNYVSSESDTFAIYRAERFYPAPIVSSPRFTDLGITSYLEWDIWYNFRSKTDFTGNYFITIDNELAETGVITFPRYWESTSIRYNISEIELDGHDIKLIVSDDGGHLSNDTNRFVPIGVFSPEKTGRYGLIIGLSVGLGAPIIAIVILTIWSEYKKKRIPIKKKYQPNKIPSLK